MDHGAAFCGDRATVRQIRGTASAARKKPGAPDAAYSGALRAYSRCAALPLRPVHAPVSQRDEGRLGVSTVRTKTAMGIPSERDVDRAHRLREPRGARRAVCARADIYYFAERDGSSAALPRGDFGKPRGLSADRPTVKPRSIHNVRAMYTHVEVPGFSLP